MLLLHYGKWDSWGFEMSYNVYFKEFTLCFIHWYVAIEWADKDA
jgi:hypothetical protein